MSLGVKCRETNISRSPPTEALCEGSGVMRRSPGSEIDLSALGIGAEELVEGNITDTL